MANAKTSKKREIPKLFAGVTVTPAEQKAFIDALDTLKGLVLKMQIGFTCPTCDNFDKGHCVYWNDKVPESQQPKGCDNWTDKVPF